MCRWKLSKSRRGAAEKLVCLWGPRKTGLEAPGPQRRGRVWAAACVKDTCAPCPGDPLLLTQEVVSLEKMN